MLKPYRPFHKRMGIRISILDGDQLIAMGVSLPCTGPWRRDSAARSLACVHYDHPAGIPPGW